MLDGGVKILRVARNTIPNHVTLHALDVRLPVEPGRDKDSLLEIDVWSHPGTGVNLNGTAVKCVTPALTGMSAGAWTDGAKRTVR